MLQVSNAFLTAAEKSVRKSSMRIHLSFDIHENIKFAVVPPAANVSANTLATSDQMKDHVEYFYSSDWARLSNSQNTIQNKKHWKLGRSVLAPYKSDIVYIRISVGYWEIGKGAIERNSNTQYGYWSTLVSGSDKKFFENQNIDESHLSETLMIQFDSELTVPQIKIIFDKNQNQYATDFDIYWRGIDPDEDTSKIEIRDNDSPEWLLEYDFENVYQLWIVPLSWNETDEPFRMSELTFFPPMATYDDSDLYEVEIIESCEQDGDIFSTGLNRLKVKFNNADDRIRSGFLYKNLKVLPEFAFQLEDGNYEWIGMGTFYATGWVYDKNTRQVILEATDNLAAISETTLVHPYIEQTKTDPQALMASILSSTNKWYSGLSVNAELQKNWRLNKGYIKPGSYKSILTELAANMGGYLYVNRNNQICIDPLPFKESRYNLTPANVFQDGVKTSLEDTYKTVYLTTVQPTIAETTVLYDGKVKKEGNQPALIKVEYKQKPALVGSISITTSFPVNTKKYVYSDYIVFEVADEGEYNVHIEGTPIHYNEKIESFADDVRSNKELALEMRFIQDPDTGKFVMNTFNNKELSSKIRKRRAKHEINCRGNPAVELGDTVSYTDKNGILRKGILTQAEYKYNGGLKARYILKGEK